MATLSEFVAAINAGFTSVATRRNQDVATLNTSIGTKLDASSRGATDGVAPLVGGLVPINNLPATVINDTHVAASQTAMLALTANKGDTAVRTDVNKTFILKQSPASTLANWQELLTPTDQVTSVAGKQGVVSLVKADVGLSSVDNTSDANKPVSTAQAAAIGAKAAKDLSDAVFPATNFTTTFTAALT